TPFVEPKSSRGGLRLWKVPGGQEVLALDNVEAFMLHFSSDGKQLACSMREATDWPDVPGSSRVVLWDTDTGKQVLKLGPFPGFASLRAFSPDGSRLAVFASDYKRKSMAVHVYDAAGQELYSLDAGPSALAFSRDGKYLIASELGGRLERFTRKDEL